jgi:hypothetical protein
MRIREIAHARPRFGFLRIWVLLRREGWPVNHKRVRRLYRLEGLQLRMRVRRRKHAALHRGPAPGPVGMTQPEAKARISAGIVARSICYMPPGVSPAALAVPGNPPYTTGVLGPRGTRYWSLRDPVRRFQS